MPKDMVERTAREKWQDENKQAASDRTRNKAAGQAFAKSDPSNKPDPAKPKKTVDEVDDDDDSLEKANALIDIATNEESTPNIAKGEKPDPVKKLVKGLASAASLVIAGRVARKKK